MTLYQQKETTKYEELLKKHESERFIDLPHIQTILQRGCGDSDGKYGSVTLPIYLTSTYSQKAPGQLYDKYDYVRGGTPNVDGFEKLMASIEYGNYGIAFASGMAAINAVLMTLQTGDHIISVDDVYGGTNRILRKVLQKFGLQNTLMDLHDLDEVRKQVKENTKMIILETPTNPTLKTCDIEQICKLAKELNLLTLVDNTFATPILQHPLLLGADMVVHSTTKYIGGHSDLCGGVVVTKSKELHDKIRFNLLSIGGCMGSFEAFLFTRSLKTLKIRMETACYNTMVLFDFLSSNEAVEKVFYPFDPKSKYYSISKR